MSFTTIDAIAAHYPGFQRGVTNQNPADTQIQSWIDNQAARITARATARGYDLTSLAAAQGWANPNTLRKSFENMLSELGQGAYDKLFVASARTGDVYPAFGGVAGQETDPADPELGSNLAFRKNGVY